MELDQFIRMLIRHRRAAGFVMAASLAVTALLCFALPCRYKSDFVILSPDAGGNALLKNLSGGAYDTGMKGWVLPAILMSEDLAVDVLSKRFTVWTDGRPRELSIAAIADARDKRSLLRSAKRYVDISIDELNGSVRVAVETPYPELSYEVARYTLEKLESYAESKRRALREESNAYYRARIQESRSGLLIADAQLGGFLEKNRAWLDSDDPGTRLELDRLRRKQRIYTSIYLELHRLRELDELKALSMIPPLEILDRPTVPTLKSWPRRKLIVLMGGAIGALLSLATAFILDLRRLSLAGR